MFFVKPFHLIPTSSLESQLPASHLSIRSAPGIITHCAPDIVVAYLHTSLSSIASLQSDGSLSARGSSAAHSSIFTVDTVVVAKTIMAAVHQSGLSSKTQDIVQPDLTDTIGEASG